MLATCSTTPLTLSPLPHPAVHHITHLVQRPARVAGNGKVEVQRQVQHILRRLLDRGRGLDLAEAVAEEPDAVDEQAVGGALDLEVAEEGVGAEEGEDLVEDVVALRVRVGRLVGGEGDERERVGRAAGLGPQREEGEVADEARGVGVVVEDGVVGLRGCVSLLLPML